MYTPVKAHEKIEQLFETEESEVLPRLRKMYNLSRDEKGALILKVKTGDAYPYRVTMKDDLHGTFHLTQQFSPRVYVAPRWHAVGTFATFDDALKRIAARHNKATTYMQHWDPV